MTAKTPQTPQTTRGEFPLSWKWPDNNKTAERSLDIPSFMMCVCLSLLGDLRALCVCVTASLRGERSAELPIGGSAGSKSSLGGQVRHRRLSGVARHTAGRRFLARSAGRKEKESSSAAGWDDKLLLPLLVGPLVSCWNENEFQKTTCA